jgi:hypothetical protein
VVEGQENAPVKPPKKPRGRKPKWTDWKSPEQLEKVRKWAEEGLWDYQIADKMGIGNNLYYTWKSEKTEFQEALKKGRDVPIRNVVNALYRSALGFSYTETRRDVFGVGDNAQIKMTTIEKQVIPNVGAQAFYLKNMDPEHWKDVKMPGSGGPGGSDDGDMNITYDYGDAPKSPATGGAKKGGEG